MSGHSKWNNIKHKKEKADAAKAKIFTKIGKEMAVAIKAGGPDPNNNSKLRDLIAKAKANNVPNDNIQRTIKKFTDNGDINFEEIVYEGYGPSGVAIIVETQTDNRNRTAGNVRAAFSKYGGNLGQNGCVGYLFEQKGVITIVDEDEEIDEDKIMEDALEAGAEDIKCDEGEYTIYTASEDLDTVRDAIIALGYQINTADLAKVPSTYVELTSEEDIANMEKMLDKFNEDDDVNLPLMIALANRGILSVIVEMPCNLAVFDVNAADGIKDGFPEIENWYIGGHSLGGAMAAKYLYKNIDKLDGIVLLASYSTELLEGTRAFTLYGTEDKVMNQEKLRQYIVNLPVEADETLINGGNHAYFGMYGEQRGDGDAWITATEQINLAARCIADFIFD